MTIPKSKCSDINPYQAGTPREKVWQIIILVKKSFLSQLFVEWYHGLLRMAIVHCPTCGVEPCTLYSVHIQKRVFPEDYSIVVLTMTTVKTFPKRNLKISNFVISYLLLLALSTQPKLATLQSRTWYNIWLRHDSFSDTGRISRQSWKLKLSNIIVQLKHHLGRAGILVLQASADTDSLNSLNSSKVLLWGCFSNMEF